MQKKKTLKLTNETCHFPIGNSLSELLPFTKKPHGTSARNEVEVERIEIQRGTVPRRLKASTRFVGWVDLQSFGQVSSVPESTKGKGRSHLQ